MLEIAICDDEPVMRKEISRHFSDYMAKRQDMDYRIRGFESGKQLLAWGHDFDLIFLDIQMEQPDGMETARRLRQRGSQSLLVFVTVLKECVFDAFEVEACDYLLKPLDTGHFERTMERVYERIRQKPAKRLLVQRGNQSQVVLLSESVYCEVQGRKIYIHQKNGEIIDYYDRMENLKSHVDGRFFQCHRSYLVNLDYVRGCEAGQVLLPGGEKIPVSRLRERELTQALLCHMKERRGAERHKERP